MRVDTGLQIRVLRGNQQGLIVSLSERSYVLGRAISHEDVGPGRLYFHDPTVASVQAIMRWDDAKGHYVISHETNQSRSWIAGLPLLRGTPRNLKPGGRLKMGKLLLVMERRQEPVQVAPPEVTTVIEVPAMVLWTARRLEPKPEPQPAIVEVVARPEHYVDLSWFTTRTYAVREGEVLHGPVAEFFEDGQLKRLTIYVGGKLSHTHHQLLLEHDSPVGRVVSDVSECVFSGGVESVVTQVDGEVDFFESETSWDVWVRKWIGHICAGATVNLI